MQLPPPLRRCNKKKGQLVGLKEEGGGEPAVFLDKGEIESGGGSFHKDEEDPAFVAKGTKKHIR